METQKGVLNMKKGLSLLLALALAVLALPALAEGTKTVNVLSWEGYVDEDTIQAFENETGIDVVWSPMDSIDDMLLKVTQSGGEGYDLILTSDYSLDHPASGGAFAGTGQEPAAQLRKPEPAVPEPVLRPGQSVRDPLRGGLPADRVRPGAGAL